MGMKLYGKIKEMADEPGPDWGQRHEGLRLWLTALREQPKDLWDVLCEFTADLGILFNGIDRGEDDMKGPWNVFE